MLSRAPGRAPYEREDPLSYVAIARKWRPTTFAEIFGQDHVTRTLSNAITLGRVHHAFLFTGARGVGKTTAARVLARALNCEKGPSPDPCGECVTCTELLAGGSPDVIEIDGASNNSVDDIRDLREAVRYLPQRGRRKIYIVDEVHMLSKGAFNALLKTLEEPPPHVVFIFATTEPQKIPDTILSRVQRFDFKRIAASVVVERLSGICEADGITIPADALRLLARAGEGSMRDSQSLLDRVISFCGDDVSVEQVADVLGLVDRALLYQMLEGMLKGEADRCLESIDKVYGFGYDLSEFTSEMLELLRNATMVGLSPSSRRYLDVPDDERARLEQLADGVPSDVFVRSFQVMLDVHDQVARAPRPRLVLEMAVARLVCIRPARPLDQMLQRVGDIERRLRQGSGRARRPASRARDDDDDPHPGGSPPPTAGRPTPSGASVSAPSAVGPAPAGGRPPSSELSHRATVSPGPRLVDPVSSASAGRSFVSAQARAVPNPPPALQVAAGDDDGPPMAPPPEHADMPPMAPFDGEMPAWEDDGPPPPEPPPGWADEGGAPTQTRRPQSMSALRRRANGAGKSADAGTAASGVPSWRRAPDGSVLPAPPEAPAPVPVQSPLTAPPDRDDVLPFPTPAWRKPGGLAAVGDEPSTVPDGDNLLEGPLPEPPPIRGSADVDARFEAFQEWMDAGGPRFDALAWDAALGSVQPPAVSIVVPSSFKRRNAAAVVEHPRVKKGVQAYFEGCTRANVLEGTGLPDKPTRRQRRQEARRKVIAVLRAEMEQHPVVRAFIEQLSAELSEVMLPDEMPSQLSGR